ncbi:hypothetical protein HQ545_00575 [Candidatus Woesearchaeota archaeon]|nr:hypothetical protein [Candidatus Woesearchaeota archaeon]
MKLETAKKIAWDFIQQIQPYCIKIEVAGSTRRGNPEPNDIEICAIPENLFGLKTIMDRQSYIKGRFPAKYSQIRFMGEKIDVFWCRPGNWGNIFLIRTGPKEFSERIMGYETRKAGLIQKEGYLWRGKERLYCYKEEEVFELLGLPYICPEKRGAR